MNAPLLPAPAATRDAGYNAALELREVVAARKDGCWYLTQFTCGHIVAGKVRTQPGDWFYCSVCMDEAANAMRETLQAGAAGIAGAIADIEAGRV